MSLACVSLHTKQQQQCSSAVSCSTGKKLRQVLVLFISQSMRMKISGRVRWVHNLVTRLCCSFTQLLSKYVVLGVRYPFPLAPNAGTSAFAGFQGDTITLLRVLLLQSALMTRKQPINHRRSSKYRRIDRQMAYSGKRRFHDFFFAF